MPTHSCVQWSTAMKTVALPSRVVRQAVAWVHLGEQVRAQQLRQLARVAAVGLDADARPTRDQRRRDHAALDALGLEPALQREARRARLVAGHDRTLGLPQQAPQPSRL